MRMRFFTWWSVVGEICVLSIFCGCCCRRAKTMTTTFSSAVVAAVSNAITIGLVGPFVIEHMIFDPYELLHSNARIHTLPMYISLLFILLFKQYFRNCIHFYAQLMLFCFDLMYILVPYEGTILLDKIEHVYNVNPIRWSIGVLLMQTCTIYIVSSRIVHTKHD